MIFWYSAEVLEYQDLLILSKYQVSARVEWYMMRFDIFIYHAWYFHDIMILSKYQGRLSKSQVFARVKWYRGTQRICSSHYLFPRGILLAGKNTGVSMSWLGNLVIDRGFAWELLTLSSISTRAGCRNSEDWGRIKKKKKKNPFPLPENSHKHTTAGQSDCACGKNLFCPGFFAFVRSFWIERFESARNSWLGNKFDQLAGKPTNFI